MKFIFEKSSFLPTGEIETRKKELSEYLEKMMSVLESGTYEESESSICLPGDDKMTERVTQVLKEKGTEKLKYIIDIGIGGSNLGTKAIYDALYGYADTVEPERFPKILFFDTCDPEYVEKALCFIKKIQNKEELLINIISKSGGTTETIVNAEMVLCALLEDGRELLSRVVITTDEDSPLWRIANEKNITTLTLPKMVGGRYSVLSPVGLFPLAAAGVDIKELQKGALVARELCLKKEGDENPALISSIFLSFFCKQGKNIHDLFVFHPEFESLGKWYRQLMGESIGKDGKGITPTVSVGSTDLHSVAQLYLGGPKDKTTCFLSTAVSKKIKMPEDLHFPLVKDIEGKNLSDIMGAIQEGVMVTYYSQKIPVISVILDDISAFSLGEFMQYKMIEMMLLGQLMGVNVFNQPHVELYKTETKKMLSKTTLQV